MDNETFYVTRTPDNLLSYQTAVVCEKLKTRYRVRTEDGRIFTFNNGASVSRGVYIFSDTASLEAKIEAYKNQEDELLELILNSEKIQKTLAEKLTSYLTIDGDASIDLNNPEVNGTDFYLTYNGD